MPGKQVLRKQRPGDGSGSKKLDVSISTTNFNFVEELAEIQSRGRSWIIDDAITLYRETIEATARRLKEEEEKAAPPRHASKRSTPSTINTPPSLPDEEQFEL